MCTQVLSTLLVVYSIIQKSLRRRTLTSSQRLSFSQRITTVCIVEHARWQPNAGENCELTGFAQYAAANPCRTVADDDPIAVIH